MSNLKTVRYDTLVLKDCTNPEIPRELHGATVVSWARGHAIAESSALEEFVSELADGFEDIPDFIQERAIAALAKAKRQLENSYDD